MLKCKIRFMISIKCTQHRIWAVCFWLVCWVVCLFICLHANAILWIKSLCGLKPWYPQVLDWIGFYYYYYCVVICVLILNFNGLFAFTKRASFAHFNNLLLSKYRKIFALGYCLFLSVLRNQQNRSSDF